MNAGTPLRLVAGTREEVLERLQRIIKEGAPGATSSFPRALAVYVLAALFPPLKPGEEPMTVQHVKQAASATYFLWNQIEAGDWDGVLGIDEDERGPYVQDLRDAQSRIEQEVRRATGE